MTAACEQIGDDLFVNLKVQPRAKQDELVGIQDSFLKVRIKAPPVDGKANSYLINYLATVFGVQKRNISILNGDNSRTKRVKIHLPARLPECLDL